MLFIWRTAPLTTGFLFVLARFLSEAAIGILILSSLFGFLLRVLLF